MASNLIPLGKSFCSSTLENALGFPNHLVVKFIVLKRLEGKTDILGDDYSIRVMYFLTFYYLYISMDDLHCDG